MQSGNLQASSISRIQGIRGYLGDVGHFLFLSLPVPLPFSSFLSSYSSSGLLINLQDTKSHCYPLCAENAFEKSKMPNVKDCSHHKHYLKK